MKLKIQGLLRTIKHRCLFYYNTWRFHIKIVNSIATLEQLIAGKSISRFGDGELYLVEGKNMCFQTANLALQTELSDVLADRAQNENCLIGLPYTLNRLKGLTARSKQFWTEYQIQHIRHFYSAINHHLCYYDAQVTRPYINKKMKAGAAAIFQKWKQLWDGKKILLAEGTKTRFGTGNDLLSNARQIQRILCPASGAFEKIDLIEQAILSESDFDLCLLALGPTASILAYRLSQKGIHAIDIGNLDIEYEWFISKAAVMTAVKGKYTCEAADGSDGKNVEEIDDPQYFKQIIKTIV